MSFLISASRLMPDARALRATAKQGPASSSDGFYKSQPSADYTSNPDPHRERIRACGVVDEENAPHMGESDERDLFRQQMRDVKRLNAAQSHPKHTKPKPPPRAHFTRADQRDVLRESLTAPLDEAVLNTGDELQFRRPHVPEAVLLKLRRGQFAVDAEIDLHGLTAVEARGALREFIAEALARRLTCVRVIHGKGRRSGPRGPVLKNVVNQWLQRTQAVLAFGSARAVDGGSGAIYVLLQTSGSR